MKKILIVDDSKLSRKMIKDILQSLGYEFFEEAEDGLDGLEKYDQYKPDIIITDIEMPKLNGLNMVQQIRQQDRDVVIIAVSTIVQVRMKYQFEVLNINLLKKPIQKEVLQSALQ